VNQNIYDIGEYRKILNGENSKKMPNVTHPVGRIYVSETGAMCNDVKTGLSVPRHTIINVKMPKGKKGKNGLLDSAYADFETAFNSNVFEDTDKKFSEMCMMVDINETDIKGKKTVAKNKNLSLAEIERTPSNLFSGSAPIIPKEYIEPFIMPKSVDDRDEITVGNFMKYMDGGQQFFIGTLAITGLYMFHQLLYGKRQ
jgi:hypothetical protein